VYKLPPTRTTRERCGRVRATGVRSSVRADDPNELLLFAQVGVAALAHWLRLLPHKSADAKCEQYAG
jgi:hypothetical protein